MNLYWLCHNVSSHWLICLVVSISVCCSGIDLVCLAEKFSDLCCTSPTIDSDFSSRWQAATKNMERHGETDSRSSSWSMCCYDSFGPKQLKKLHTWNHLFLGQKHTLRTSLHPLHEVTSEEEELFLRLALGHPSKRMWHPFPCANVAWMEFNQTYRPTLL